MIKKYRIGIVGFAQMHVLEIVKAFNSLPEKVEWVGGADIEPAVPSISNASGTRKKNLEMASKMCPLPAIYDDYRRVIKEKPDIIILCCENSLHGKIAEEILLQGIHVIVEKPMATTLEDALKMARAAKEGKAVLIVNWPVAWWPAVHLVAELAKKDVIGEIFKFHYRNRDSFGPFSYGQNMTDFEKSKEWWYQSEAGGGAMLDYCCYGCSLSRWILGKKPVSAFGLKMNVGSRFSDVDDYSAMTVLYQDAVAILEGSWATCSGGGIPNGPVLFGNKGTIVSDRYSNQVKIFTKRHSVEPDEILEAQPLPGNRNNVAKEIFNHLETGEALYPILDLQVNLDAMAALDAGIRSARTGKLEKVGEVIL